MTPKEKAKELIDKYNFLKEIFTPSIHEQKQCALIAVDEILKNPTPKQRKLFEKVKEEINKL
jgi:hypothetical protein